LPVVLPGAAISPGTSSWSLEKAADWTRRAELGTPVTPVALAVIVVSSAFLRVVVSAVEDCPRKSLRP